MLDKNTFGNSQCAENLVKILNEENNPNHAKKVSAFLGHNNIIIKELSNIPNEQVKKELARLYRESLFKNTNTLPEKIKTHAINLLITKMRKTIYKEE